MFQTNFQVKIKTKGLCLINFCRKSCLLWDNVEKYGTATWRQCVRASLL